MRRASVLLFAGVFALVSWGAGAASPRDTLVVSTAWLAAHLADPNLVLLQVGDKAEYAKRHIRGARFVSLADVSVSAAVGKGLLLEMPYAEDLRKRLEAIGVSDQSRVIVCYDEDRVPSATRVIFTFDYAGLGDRAALLDGGLGAWTREGRAVTDEVPPPRTGALAALKIRPIVVDADRVRASLGKEGVAVIDARASSLYDGVETGGSNEHRHRTGHIAGARSIPFDSITDEKTMLRSPEALAALFAKAGVKPSDVVIGYCHIGQQATEMLLAARTLGHVVLLYDGSFEDWSRHRDFPVDNPSRRSAL